MKRRDFFKIIGLAPFLKHAKRGKPAPKRPVQKPRTYADDIGCNCCVWLNTTGDCDWNNPANWSSGASPRNGDSVYIDRPATIRGPLFASTITVAPGGELNIGDDAVVCDNLILGDGR